MSETVAKILSYLGEKPRKTGADVRAGKAVPRTAVRSPAGKYLVRASRAPRLSSDAVARLAAKLAVAPEYVLDVSDISARTFQRRQANREPLTEAESDRVLRIARILLEAERVFGDAAKASRWLSSESRILGARPLDLLATDAGARDVEQELVRIDYGDFA